MSKRKCPRKGNLVTSHKAAVIAPGVWGCGHCRLVFPSEVQQALTTAVEKLGKPPDDIEVQVVERAA